MDLESAMKTLEIDRNDERFKKLCDINKGLLSAISCIAHSINEYEKVPLDTPVSFKMLQDMDKYNIHFSIGGVVEDEYIMIKVVNIEDKKNKLN